MDLLNPGFGIMFFSLIAFLIVLFLLAKFAWKPILKTLKDRETGIEEALSAAEKAKAEIANLKAENETLLQQAREERAQLLKDAKETSDKIIADAQAKAQSEGSRIIAEAQQAINTQKNAALAEVKNQVGAIAVQIAEKVLRNELADKAKQEAYVSQLVDDIKLN